MLVGQHRVDDRASTGGVGPPCTAHLADSAGQLASSSRRPQHRSRSPSSPAGASCAVRLQRRRRAGVARPTAWRLWGRRFEPAAGAGAAGRQRRQHRRFPSIGITRRAGCASSCSLRADQVVAVHREAAGGLASRTTTGRRNTIRLVFLRAARPSLNRLPSTGHVAQARHLGLVALGIRPADQAAEHDDGAVVDHHGRSIERLLVEGRCWVPGWSWPTSIADWTPGRSSCAPCRSSPICGRMRSVRPTSLRSMVWKGLTAPCRCRCWWCGR